MGIGGSCCGNDASKYQLFLLMSLIVCEGLVDVFASFSESSQRGDASI